MAQVEEADPGPLTPRTRGPGHWPGLPARRTRLIGREAELATIRTAVTEADGRLVTLTGPGGVGKSVLALEVARSFVDGPPDRWLAELAAVDDGEQLDQALCATLGLVDPSREAAELLIDVLSARDALLVLDNCEHLLPAVARLVDRLLERCPDLRIGENEPPPDPGDR